MNILLVYDSLHGNTKNIAEIIGKELSALNTITFINIDEFSANQLEENDLLLIAAPTHAFRAKQETIDMIEGLSQDDIKGYPIVSFDTRIELSTIKNPLWRWMVNKAGYASPFINKQLKRKGANVLMKSMGFLVLDKEGPLASGETDKAKQWTKELQSVIELQNKPI